MPLLCALAQSLNTAGVLKIYKPLEESDGTTNESEISQALTKRVEKIGEKLFHHEPKEK